MDLLAQSTIVQLYNGNSVSGKSVGRSASVTLHDITVRCAQEACLSPASYRVCLIVCSECKYITLPYKKSCRFNTNSPNYFRFINQECNIDDLAHKCPGTLLYLYHQTRYDMFELSKNIMNNEQDFRCEIIALDLAIKAKGLGMCGVKRCGKLEGIDKILSVLLQLSGHSNTNMASLRDRFRVFIKSNNSAHQLMKLFIIKVEQKIANPITKNLCCPAKYNISNQTDLNIVQKDESISTTISVNPQGIHITMTNPEIRIIPYNQIDNISMNFKKNIIILYTTEGEKVNLWFHFNSKANMESVLALIDYYHRLSSGSPRLLLGYSSSDDFDPKTFLYHWPNSGDKQSNTFGRDSSSYTLMNKEPNVLDFLDSEEEAKKVVKFYNTDDQYLIIPSHKGLMNPERQLFQLFFLVAEGKIANKPVMNEGGRYRIDEKKTYKSLDMLLAQVKFVNGRSREVVQNLFSPITEEMVRDLREMPLISPNSVCFSTNPSENQFLQSIHNGNWNSPIGDQQEIKAALFRGKHHGQSIQAAIKNLLTINLPEHDNILQYFGMYINPRTNFICCIRATFGQNTTRYIICRGTVLDNDELYTIGLQIISGLLYLHSIKPNKVIHGFPALHNTVYCPLTKCLKLVHIGVLELLLMKNRYVHNPLIPKDYEISDTQSHPARWLHRNCLKSSPYPWTPITDR